jgi:hypothetical protein
MEDLIRWSKEPTLLPKVTFGKYRGQNWNAVQGPRRFWLNHRLQVPRPAEMNTR